MNQELGGYFPIKRVEGWREDKKNTGVISVSKLLWLVCRSHFDLFSQ